MSEKEFVLNVIVKKLELRNDLLTSDKTIVKFEWGDDQDLNFEIKSDRINVSDFNVMHNVEFKRNASEFVVDLETKPFKLTVFEVTPGKKSNGISDSKDLSQESEANESEDKSDVMEKVGEAECTWPLRLVASFKTNDFSPFPFVEHYELLDNGSKVGLLTLSILLHLRCEEDSKTVFDGPYVDKQGKLGVFKDCENHMDPNDIFFVIGNPPCPQPMATNILATCGGKSPCPGRFESNRFKFMQGSLVQDCNVLSGCGAPTCCQVQGDQKLCEEVLQEIKSRSSKPEKRKITDPCYKNPCERLFGPMTSSCDEMTSTDNNDSCRAQFHTIDCERKRRKKQKKKRKSCRCRFSEQPEQVQQPLEPYQPVDNSQLIEEAIKNDRIDQRKKEILYPHTCPEPQLLDAGEPTQPRVCPICCEDISWVPLYGTCPKCGFKPSLVPPLEETPYDENKTAQEILSQFKEDVKKYRREKKISSLGGCNCTPHNECLNCQIRKLSMMQKKGAFDDADGEAEEPDKAESKGQWTLAPRGSRQMQGKENKVNNIIDEVLKKRAQRRASTMGSDYKIPSMKRILEWCKKKSAREPGIESSDHEHEDEDSLSEQCTECSSRLKAKVRGMLPECSISTSDLTKKSSEGSESEKRRRQKKGVRKQPGKKFRLLDKDEYPGVMMGHTDCVRGRRKVPRYMGWLWSASIDDSRRGWRPGAVRRETHKIMKYFLKERDAGNKPVYQQVYESHVEDICVTTNQEYKMPMIRVVKKNGQYRVTVHPMRDPSKPLKPGDTRSLPIEFTIDKDPVEILKREVKSRLKQRGFKPCTCGKPIYDCECRSDLERDKLEEALEDICDDLCIQENRNTMCLSDTTKSDSEVDLEFSPPAALMKLPLPKKPTKSYGQTQCDPDDIKINMARQNIWKLDPKEAMSRVGHPCGGMSRPPPCRPPWAGPKKENLKGKSAVPPPVKGKKEVDKKAKDTSKLSDKSKEVTGPSKSSKSNAEANKQVPAVKSSELKKSDRSKKSTEEPGKAEKVAKATNKADEMEKGVMKPEKPPPQPAESKLAGGDADKSTKPPDGKPPDVSPAKKPEPTKPPKPLKPSNPPTKPSSKPPAKSSSMPTGIPPAPGQGRKPPREPLRTIKPFDAPSKQRSSTKPDQSRRSTTASAATQKSQRSPSRTAAAPDIKKRFSLSEIPILRPVPIRPRRNQPCKEVSLMGVRFRSLDCEQAAALECPIPPCESPCKLPCFCLNCGK